MSYFIDFMDFSIYFGFFPLKGGAPDNKIYRITPNDQISHF